eukprot:5069253-Pyramimonas_sp.AAC.1
MEAPSCLLGNEPYFSRLAASLFSLVQALCLNTFCPEGNSLFGLPLAGPIALGHPRGFPANAWKSFARKLACE